MAKRRNSAMRLHQILKAAAAQGKNTKIVDVWAHSFGLTDKPSTKRDLEVVENLGLAHKQFELMQELADQSDYSAELYQMAFNRIDRVLMVGNLLNPWSTLSSHLTADTLLAIEWLSEVLPDEASAIDSEFAKEIENQLSELQKLLEKSKASAGLKGFVERQISIIEKALRQNSIIGTKAIRDALYEGFSSSHENQQTIDENEDTEELGRLGKVWQKMKKAPGAVINTNKALEAGGELLEKGQKAISFFDNFSL